MEGMYARDRAIRMRCRSRGGGWWWRRLLPWNAKNQHTRVGRRKRRLNAAVRSVVEEGWQVLLICARRFTACTGQGG